MKEFYKFDLQMIGEMSHIFEQFEKQELSMEEKNKFKALANYCEMLQSRLKLNMEAGQGDVLSSQI